MPTPKSGYSWAGEKLPGTTTVIGRFKDSGGLLQWAFKQGQSGAAHLYEQAEKAADIGTLAHALIEAHINGEIAKSPAPVEQTMLDKAAQAFEQYCAWERQTRITMLYKFQEIQLVSPVYKFGGTPDAIGEIDGKFVLLDWKTSNAVYPDYLVQLAAYKHLIEEGVRMDTGEPLGIQIAACHLLRVSKDFPDFEHRSFTDLELPWRQFVRFREAYEDDKVLKARVK